MIDQEKIEEAVRLLLEGIGEDSSREGLLDTPARVARMYEEIYEGMEKSPKEYLEKTFLADGLEEMGAFGEMVLEKDVLFYSICEHHLLPFFGRVHVAYVPDGKVVGLSKLARTVELFARRPQLQERFTAQIADALMEYLKPLGAMILVEAEHMCMTMRGVKKPGSKTLTYAVRGSFAEDMRLQEKFFHMVK